MPKKHSPRFLAIVDDAKTRVREIRADEVLAGGGGVLVDVREGAEFAAAHARGAVWMGKGVLERDVEQAWPHLDTELTLYCGGGYRSALAADNLQKMGYTRVWSLAGGFRAWKAAGGPVTGPPGQAE